MFVTETLGIASQFDRAGKTGWNWISFDGEAPMYLVTLTWLVDEDLNYTHRLYNHYAQIRRLIEGESEEEYTVERIELLAPPKLSATGCWSVNQLQSIYAEDIYSTPSEFIYELADGTTLSEVAVQRREDLSNHLKLLTTQPRFSIWQVPEEMQA